MAESLKKKTVKGVAWTATDRVANLTIGFIIGVVLARILSPGDYGLLAMIAVFNAIAYVFLNSGFGGALIRKPDLTENDNTTAFIFNIAAGAVMYGVIWLIAPLVAQFYDKPILAQLLRAEGILLIISAFKIVQNTQLSRALNFKAKAIINVSSHIAAGILAIVAAYRGLGVWSLVIQHIATGLFSLILFWIVSPWRPRGRWDKNSFRYLWGYGSKMLASGLLDKIYANIYPIIIGKFFSAADLGQYARAKDYTRMPSQGLTEVIQQVTFPVLSRIQNDDNRLRDNYRRMLRFTAFIMFPVMVAIAALAHPLIITLVTAKWEPCVPYLQIICFASMWYPIHAINLNLLQVKGRSDLFLRLEIIKKVIATIAIFVSVPFGITGICIGAVCTSLIGLAINTYYTGRLINVGFFMQMRDLTPTLLLSLLTGALIYAFTRLVHLPEAALLTIGILAAAAIYLTVARLTRMPELREALDIIHRR